MLSAQSQKKKDEMFQVIKSFKLVFVFFREDGDGNHPERDDEGIEKNVSIMNIYVDKYPGILAMFEEYTDEDTPATATFFNQQKLDMGLGINTYEEIRDTIDLCIHKRVNE